MKTRLRVAIFIALNVAIAAGMSAYIAGTRLLSAAPAAIPDSALALPHERVTFQSASGSLIRGWWVAGAGRGAVVLLHGIKGNRLDMVGRAEFLNRAGYSVLLFDFQAHGESPGGHVTLGYLEARDAAAAVAYAQSRRPGESVSVIGVSLGGAAALLGPEPLPVRALVLEAVYPRIQEAVKNRMRVQVGPLADVLAPMLFVQLPWRAGVSVDDLSPLDRITTVTAPVLVITGSEDHHTTLRDSEALFAAAAGPKEMWVIPGAVHENFAAYAPQEYQARVLAFLDKYR
ncbi:MAG: alpha/beta hydrolase [Burkholderiales bacterium]